jgi:hypothetical protein
VSNFTPVTRASPYTRQANNDALFDYPGGDPTDTSGDPNHLLYPVQSAYSMATGLGSMIAPTLASSLCSLRAPVYTVLVTYPGNQQSIVNQPAVVQVRATDSGGVGLSYTATGLPPGLAITPAGGLITGTPTAPGSYTVTVSADDNDANGASTSFNWAIVSPQPPTISAASLGNVAKGKARLSFRLAAGSFSPPIQSFSISLPGGVRFAKKTKTLGKEILLEGATGRRAKYSLKLSHGVLTVTLKSTLTALFFSIVPPGTSVAGSLAMRVKHHKVKTLNVVVKVVNSSRATTRLVLKLKV